MVDTYLKRLEWREKGINFSRRILTEKDPILIEEWGLFVYKEKRSRMD